MKLFYAMAALLLAGTTCAQIKGKPPADTIPGRRWFVTLSPLAVINPDITLMTGAEYELTKRWKLVSDLGYIAASAFRSNGDNTEGKCRGFIVRPGVKMFTKAQGTGTYFQLQGFYKQVDHPEENWVTINTPSGTFQQLQGSTFRRRVFGLTYLFGRTSSISKTYPLWIDAYIGLGVRFKRNGTLGQPLYWGEEEGFSRPFDLNKSDNSPNLAGGFRLIFGL